MLAIPTLRATTLHGWLATIGATRLLSTQWPNLTLHFTTEDPAPVFGNGPTTTADLVDTARQISIDTVPDGAVLPGVDAAYPPQGKGWWRYPDAPATTGTKWDGDEAELWQATLTTASGLLHPLLSPHAAQTVRGMIAKALGLLRDQPDLLTRALAGPGAGLSRNYPGGLWITDPRGDPPVGASPGRDWLALMALPWMPAVDDTSVYVPGSPYRRGAPGWRWRITGRGPRQLVYGWWLWSQPLPAAAIPAVLAAPSPAWLPGPTLRCGARRPTRGRTDPPLLREFTPAEISAGGLDDVRLVGEAEAVERAHIKAGTLRSYVARGQCPAPDATDEIIGKCWTEGVIVPWLERTRRPGKRTDLDRPSRTTP